MHYKFTLKGNITWDEVVTIVCASYQFFPNGQSQEPSLLLMFVTDAYLPILANMLQPKMRYLGDISSMLSLKMLRKAYMVGSSPCG